MMPAPALEITDMAGRRIMLPENIERIITTDPRASLAVYAIKSSSLIRRHFVSSPDEEPQRVLGPRHGQPFLPSHWQEEAQHANGTEAYVLNADVIVAVLGQHEDPAGLERSLANRPLPVIFLRLDQLNDYPAAFALLGQLTHEEFHAAELASYIDKTLLKIRTAHLDLPQHRRVHVYYDDFSELIALQRLKGDLKSDFFPEFVISHDSTFAGNISDDARSPHVKAAASGKVVTVPNMPFNWIDSSPTLMQLLGLQWLANTFYPDAFPINLAAETKYFYRLFLHLDPSDQELGEILDHKPNSQDAGEILTSAPM